MTPQQAFADYVVEQMQAFGPVQAKRMFGGHGIFRDGLMFALIIHEQLYLKADAALSPRFVERGLRPFTYEARGKTQSVSYYEAPAEVFDAPDAMAEWARLAFQCALQGRKAPRRKTAPKAPSKTTPAHNR